MNDTDLTSEEIFNFPCDYPIKVFGKSSGALQASVCAIIQRHSDKLQPQQITSKQSSKGGYTSVTVRIVATSRAQLDAINTQLQACDLVAYVL